MNTQHFPTDTQALLMNSADLEKAFPALEKYSERHRQRLLQQCRTALQRGRKGVVSVGEMLDFLKNRGK